jgi:hypothetical protein
VSRITRRAISDMWRTEASCLPSASGGVETIVEKRVPGLNASAPSPAAGSQGLTADVVPRVGRPQREHAATRTRSGGGPIRRAQVREPPWWARGQSRILRMPKRHVRRTRCTAIAYLRASKDKQRLSREAGQPSRTFSDLARRPFT